MARDHLFINYASEDGIFAEWLTLKLAGEGYRVWCDRIELLGGESFPKDIEHALRERTCRVLSLISEASKEKDNPLKERTLALNIGRERGQEFVIPLNLGLHRDELPWQLADLTYVPFEHGWAAGLAQLLKKLDRIGGPRAFTGGRDSIRQYMLERERLSGTPERLWTNLLPVAEYPRSVLRITLGAPLGADDHPEWLRWHENEVVVGAFEPPPHEIAVARVEKVEWVESDDPRQRAIARNVATFLLRDGLRRHCLAKGLRESADGEYLYFPQDLVAGDRLRFVTYTGERSYVSATGERTAYTTGGRERFRYHLALQFRPDLRRYGHPVIQVRNRIYLTDLSGVPFVGKKILRRRKVLAKDWWNHQWLSRLLATVAFLGDANGDIVLTAHASERVVIKSTPLTLKAPDGIRETGAVPIEDESAILDEVNVPPELEDDGDESG